MRDNLKSTAAPLAALALVCAGCVPSLHGVAERQDGIIAEELEGRWQQTTADGGEEESNALWEFTLLESEQAYRLDYTDAQGNIGEFTVRLTRIGENEYLDLFPVRPQRLDEVNFDDLSGFYRHHLLPIHTFARIDRSDSTLSLSFMDLRRVDDFLTEHPDAIAHERTDLNGDLLLTASTAELREFVARPEAVDLFNVPIVLNRESDE